MELMRRRLLLMFALISTIIFTIGFTIGLFSVKRQNPSTISILPSLLVEDSDIRYQNELFKEIKAEHMMELVRELSQTPRLAGTKQDKESAELIANKFKEFKLDSVEILDYDVLLSYPHETLPNSLQIIDTADSNRIEETIEIKETLFKEDESTHLKLNKYSNPYSAYSKNGTIVSNELYFVNYCTKDDFNFITKIKNINLNGKIILCKLGKVFRGDKTKLAESYGVKGVLLFMDTKQPSNDGFKYPHGEYLPDDGAQWGSLYREPGDPLTPLYPSLNNTYRQEINDTKELPQLIVQTIGTKLAKRIFNELLINNEQVHKEWMGNNLNVNWTYGGVLKNAKSLGVSVYSTLEIRKIHNVIGVLRGELEPHDYIILGAHRDTWSFGSIDDTSGTSILIELARGLSNLRENSAGNWRPKRSIIFCSFGAEEHAIIGSTEFVEEFNKKLLSNALVYINIDPGVKGNYTFLAQSSPLLFDFIKKITKTIKINDEETIYTRWLNFNKQSNENDLRIEAFSGSGDNLGFMQRCGIPIIDPGFYRKNDITNQIFKDMGTHYELYHTSYETFNLVNKFIDPGFIGHEMLAKTIGELVRVLSDTLLIPFNPLSYSKELLNVYSSFISIYGTHLNKANLTTTLNYLKDTIDKLNKRANEFNNLIKDINLNTNYNQIRIFNRQLRNFEKSLIDPLISFNRMGNSHLIYQPSKHNSYLGNNFPLLSDSIIDALDNVDNWSNVNKTISFIIYGLNSAISILNDPIKFRYY